MNLRSMIFGAVIAAMGPMTAHALTVTITTNPGTGSAASTSFTAPVTTANGSLATSGFRIPSSSPRSTAVSNTPGGSIDVTAVIQSLAGGDGRVGSVPFEIQIDGDIGDGGFVELQLTAGLDPTTGLPFGDLQATLQNLVSGEFDFLNVTSSTTQNQTTEFTLFSNFNNNNLTFGANTNGDTPGDLTATQTVTTTGGYVAEGTDLSFYVYWDEAINNGPGADQSFTLFFEGADSGGSPPAIPLPAGVVLLLSALGGFGVMRWRRQA